MDSNSAGSSKDVDFVRKYAIFLLSTRLDQCAVASLNISKDLSLPLLEQFSQLNDREIHELSKNSIRKFLTDLSEGNLEEAATIALAKWKADKLPEIRRNKISSNDINLIYSVRKQVLLEFLPDFTSDPHEIVNTIRQIELLFLRIETKAYNTYLSIQQEISLGEKEFSTSLLDNSIDGILAWDKDFNIIAWNAVLEKQNKISKEEAIGKNIFELYPAYQQTQERAAMSRVLKGEKVHIPEVPYLHKEGYFELNMVPLPDHAGQIIGGISIIHDISYRKKTEKIILEQKEELQAAVEELKDQHEELISANEILSQQKQNIEEKNKALKNEIAQRTQIEMALKKERSFVEAILDNMREGIVACDENGKLSVFNKATLQFHGLPQKPLEESEWPQYYQLYQADGKKLMSPQEVPLSKAYAGQKIRDVEMIIRPEKGVERVLLANGQPIINAEGERLGAVVVMHDITDRKKAEERLIQSRDSYLTILQDFPALIWRSDANSQCDYFNQTWLDFTGQTFKDEVEKGWSRHVHPDDLEKSVVLFKSSFKKRKAFTMECRLRRHNGEYRWLWNIGKPIYDFQGEFQGFLGTCFDIQQQKEAEKEIKAKNAELQQTLEKLKEAKERLKKLNSELEERVKERTNELLVNQEELKSSLEQTIRLNQLISERENFLSSIIDQTPVSTAIYDAEGTQTRINKACLSLFGVEDESQGVGKYNVFKDNSLIGTPAYEKIKSVFEEGKIARFAIDYDLSKVDHVNIPSGRPITIIATAFPIKDAEGKVKNVVIQHEDITEKTIAEEALKASEEQLRLITDSLPVLIAYIDKEERYRFNNKAYEDWFNRSTSEIYGKTVREIVGEKAYKTIHKPIQRVLNGEEHYYEAHLDYGKAGSRYVAINYIPHKQGNETQGFYTLINDISKQKEVQRALETALQETNDKNEELIKINTDLDNFIYIASHDLKSPIVNLEGLVLALKKITEMGTHQKEAKILGMIDSSIDKFKKTILDLTEVTKAQRNLEEDKENITIHEVVEEVKGEIKEMIQASKAEITEVLQVERVFFSKVNLKSIVYNLLSNAVKYRRDDVQLKIKISTYREDSNVVLSIKDNGLGLTPSQQSKLFTMFKRMHSHVEGSGIGLYILKRIAENNGGKVDVSSELNRGTEFKVYFNDNWSSQ